MIQGGNFNVLYYWQVGGANVMIQGGDFNQSTGGTASVVQLGHDQVFSGGTIYQMVQTPQGLVAQPIQVANIESSPVWDVFP